MNSPYNQMTDSGVSERPHPKLYDREDLEGRGALRGERIIDVCAEAVEGKVLGFRIFRLFQVFNIPFFDE
jgi:hypothetical protein